MGRTVAAGAAALGAVLDGHVPLESGQRVCVVASGGNVDLERLPALLALAAEPDGVGAR